MHGVQLQLSFDSINLQFFEYAFLNESSVTSWVEHCINHLSSFGVVMLVYSNWNKHRICDGIGGFSSITGTCTAASCFGLMNSSCLIFTAMLRRNLNFIIKNSWVGHTTSFAHLLVSTS